MRCDPIVNELLVKVNHFAHFLSSLTAPRAKDGALLDRPTEAHNALFGDDNMQINRGQLFTNVLDATLFKRDTRAGVERLEQHLFSFFTQHRVTVFITIKLRYRNIRVLWSRVLSRPFTRTTNLKTCF